MSLLPLLEAVERDIKQWRQTALSLKERDQVVARLDGIGQLLRQIEHAFTGLAPENLPRGDDGTAETPAATLVGLAPEWQLFHVLPRLIERTLHKIETELKLQIDLVGLEALEPLPPATPAMESAPEHRVPFDWSAAEVIFSYLPMWQISKKAINSYLCQLALKAGEEIYRFEALFDEDLDEVVIASLDRLVLRKALQDISLLVKRKRQNTIVVPVHFATLASSRTRREYLSVVALVRPELRPYLIWELVYPHIGMSNGPIRQAAALLKAQGRAILLRVGLDCRHFDELAAAGIYAAGADLEGSTESETDIIHKIEVFKTRCERSGLNAYLHGANSLSLATAAVCAGFDHIDGDVIARPIDNPEDIHTYRIESPYAAMLDAIGR